LVLLSSSHARAEPPSSATSQKASTSPGTPACPELTTTASIAEERAFEDEARRYQRLAEVTERIVREREEREFEAATERYRRFSELTRRLAEKAERELERSFQVEVDLYLKKRELTRDLVERSAAASKPTPASPVW